MVSVAFLTFLVIDLAPGSYLDELATNPQISAEALERIRVQYGLDQPFYRKFWRWGRSTVTGDFGYSFVYQRRSAGLSPNGYGTRSSSMSRP